MQKISTELQERLAKAISDFVKISPTEWDQVRGEGKWTKKQILGHLIDSALNNMQRFVRGTYETNFRIVYQQEQWVKVQHYEQVPIHDLIALWKLLNEQIARVLSNYPEDKILNTADVGQFASEILTMEEIAGSYVSHLEHHLKQILP